MTAQTPPSPVGLRALTREAVRARIMDEALMLFDRHGFDETTVDDIAHAVGLSSRSFFRYFPSKEDVVIGDLVIAGTPLRDDVASKLADQTPWHALRHAMTDAAAQIDADPQRWLRILRVINSAASLRARNLEKHLTWAGLLVPVIAARLDPSAGSSSLRARVLVETAFSCLDAALAEWADTAAAGPFARVLHEAFETVSSESSR